MPDDPIFSCPREDKGPPYGYDDLLKRFVNSDGTPSAFGEAFAQTLKDALQGNRDARLCIEAWYQPAESELLSLGINQSNVGSKSRCTDSGHLLVGKLKELYPKLFYWG